MPKFSDMFPSGVEPGMYSSAMLDEMEREKARERLRSMLGEKRKQKVAQINQDRAPELPVDLSPEPTSEPVRSVSPTVPDMMPEPQGGQPSRFDPNTYQPEPTPKAPPLAGFAPQPSDDDELDSRKMLYDYLKNRRASEPAFQEQYKELSRDAETGRVLSQWASGLGEMASMAGTLQGKRADVGDTKSLPAAIYGGMRRNADELMGLRRLSNNEQVSDIRMLRDIERGDLDALKTQKIQQDMQRQRQQPKVLQYFIPEDGKNPPRMVMMDAEGKLVYQDLPQGARPTNETFMAGAPLYTQAGEVVIPSTQKSTGKTTFTPAPAGTRTGEQIRISNQEEYNNARLELEKVKSEMQNANAEQRLELEKKLYELRKAMDAFTMGMKDREQDFKEEQGSKEKVKKLSAKDISGLSEAKNSQNIINDLLSTINKYQDIMGPVEGSLRSSKYVKPFDERAKLFDADIRRIRQVIGKMTEGGVLRKEDEYKYLEMLPNMSDTPKVARYKAQQFGAMLKRDYQNHVKMLRDQGYDTTGLGGESRPSRKPLKEMTREEKLKELEEHTSRGR